MTITLTREEAQSVLDALEQVTKQMLSARDELAERGARPVINTHHQKIWDRASEAYTDQAIPAAETLRARLSAPEQLGEIVPADEEQLKRIAKLVEPELEPVAWGIANTRPTEKHPLMMVMTYKPELSSLVVPLYTAPPQREWQGLTDEEIAEMHHEIKVKGMGAYKTEDIYRAIEAKLKEKNNA